MKILIRNLDRSTTEAEVRTLFEAHGTVQSCTIVMDKKSNQSKGFGFVEMPKAGEAKIAITNLNGKEVADNKIRVKKAESKPEAEKAEPEKHGQDDIKKQAVTADKKPKTSFQGYGKKTPTGK